MRNARLDTPSSLAPKKLLVVRDAAAHPYPTGDPEAIEREIAQGYAAEAP